MPCYDKNLAPSNLSSAGFPNATQCVQSPCDERGLCCYGANGVLSGQCRCYSDPPMKGVFVPGETTCCPGCDNVGLGGGCCRETWVNDGNGACCPQECCAIGGENGGCCPVARPYCCPDGCQQTPPVPEEQCTAFIQTGYPCPPRLPNHTQLHPTEFTISVPTGQFTMGVSFDVPGVQLGGSAQVLNSWRAIVNGVATQTLVPSFNNIIAGVQFCKPFGLGEVTVVIELEYQQGQDNPCPGGDPIWSVTAFCLNRCQCGEVENPLP